MTFRVCLDASVALMLLLPDELSPKVEGLWRSWIREGTEVIAPPLFFAEVTSVLRESVHFGRLLPEEGDEAFRAFQKLGVRSVDLPDLQARVWKMAKTYERPGAYDAQYLAVATAQGCELWTGDRRLVNAVRAPWLRWVGDSTSEPQ